MGLNLPFLDHSRHDDPRELKACLAGRLLDDARLQIRHLCSRIGKRPTDWHAGMDPAALSAIRRGLVSARALCTHIVKTSEKTFLVAEEIRNERFADAMNQQTLVSNLISCQTYIGSDEVPAYHSLLGWWNDSPVHPMSLARDTGKLILVAGSQGGGKTVMSTVIGEVSQEAEPPLTSEEIPPTCYAFFHIEEQDRLPQLIDGLKKNPKQADLDLLYRRLGVGGKAIERLRLAVPRTLLPDLMPRLLPYQDLGLEIVPLKVRLSQLGQPGLQGALGDIETRYVQRMLDDAQDQGRELTIAGMRRFIDNAKDINSTLKGAAHAKLNWLDEIAAGPDEPGIEAVYEPFVSTVTYLGGPYVSQRRVLPILVGLLHGIMMPSAVHGEFQRVITVDEINLLEKLDAAWTAFIRTGRMVRHKGSTLILMGQDLNCVPDELFGLAELVFVFMLRNPRIWEYIRDRVGSLHGRRWSEISSLQVAECIVGMSRSTHPDLRQAAAKLKIRPPRCQHGGFSRAMV